jgi:hypothetical protein
MGFMHGASNNLLIETAIKFIAKMYSFSHNKIFLKSAEYERCR